VVDYDGSQSRCVSLEEAQGRELDEISVTDITTSDVAREGCCDVNPPGERSPDKWPWSTLRYRGCR